MKIKHEALLVNGISELVNKPSHLYVLIKK